MLLRRYICNEQPLRSDPLDAHAFRASNHAHALAGLHVLQGEQHHGDAAAIVEAHERRLGFLCQFGGRWESGPNEFDGAVGHAVEAAEIEFLRRIGRRKRAAERDGGEHQGNQEVFHRGTAMTLANRTKSEPARITTPAVVPGVRLATIAAMTMTAMRATASTPSSTNNPISSRAMPASIFTAQPRPGASPRRWREPRPAGKAQRSRRWRDPPPARRRLGLRRSRRRRTPRA